VGNSLDELASYFRPLAEQLIERCSAAGIPVRIEDTGRTPVEQVQKLSTGQSWTKNSKHLPQPPEWKAEAIDLVPEIILEQNKKNWDPTNPVWLKMGEIGESLGLVWGGRWIHINNGIGDPGHFQFNRRGSSTTTTTTTTTTVTT
jgi:D-alanyl-D-alanine carboxypeptidase-like protein